MGSILNSALHFRTNRELKALDLKLLFGKYWMSAFSVKEERFLRLDAHIQEKCVWMDIDNAFSRFVNRTDRSTEFAPTLILAELLHEEG